MERRGPEEWPTAGLEFVQACPVCTGRARRVLHAELEDRTFFCAPGRWTLHECTHCRAAYLDPRPKEDAIHLAYERYYTHTRSTGTDGRTRALRRYVANGYLNREYGYDFTPAARIGPLVLRLLPRYRWYVDVWARHLRRPRPGARLLDVGCGSGGFLVAMKRGGWEVHGVEPDHTAVAEARAADLSVEHGTVRDGMFEPGSFDAVTLSHVLEHTHDPVATLRACRRVLRPSGVVWLATPNLASSGHARFGRSWFGLDPPRHIVLFTLGALERGLAAAGLELVALFPSFRARAWYGASAAIAEGRDPFAKRRLGSRRRLGAFVADLGSWLDVKTAEELTVMARPRSALAPETPEARAQRRSCAGSRRR